LSRTHRSSLSSCTTFASSCPQALPNNLSNYYGPDRCARGWCRPGSLFRSDRGSIAVAGPLLTRAHCCSSMHAGPRCLVPTATTSSPHTSRESSLAVSASWRQNHQFPPSLAAEQSEHPCICSSAAFATPLQTTAGTGWASAQTLSALSS
jgi:hypothetical protein